MNPFSTAYSGLFKLLECLFCICPPALPEDSKIFQDILPMPAGINNPSRTALGFNIVGCAWKYPHRDTSYQMIEGAQLVSLCLSSFHTTISSSLKVLSYCSRCHLHCFDCKVHNRHIKFSCSLKKQRLLCHCIMLPRCVFPLQTYFGSNSLAGEIFFCFGSFLLFP